MSLVEELKQVLFHPRRKLHQFIAINVFVFFAIKLIGGFEPFFHEGKYVTGEIIHYLSLPASFDKLLYQPWSVLTYMFLHEEFFHLLFNMLGLYWFGQILEEYLGSKKFVTIYLLGGIAGGALYIALFNLLPIFANALPSAFALGASAGVLAVIVGSATLLPDYQLILLFFGLVKIKYIALFYVLLDLINITGDNAGGHIAHLGGAVLGLAFVKQLQQGIGVNAFFKKFSKLFKRKPKMKVAYKTPITERKGVKKQVDKQEVIDRILDKISKCGYDGLTKEEKDILFRASQEKE